MGKIKRGFQRNDSASFQVKLGFFSCFNHVYPLAAAHKHLRLLIMQWKQLIRLNLGNHLFQLITTRVTRRMSIIFFYAKIPSEDFVAEDKSDFEALKPLSYNVHHR